MALDPERHRQLFTIVMDEVVAGTHNDSYSCTKGLLWLKRCVHTAKQAKTLRSCCIHWQSSWNF